MNAPLSADQLAAALARPPRPTCRTCREVLDPVLVDREDNTGLHMGCEPAPEPAPPAIRQTLPEAVNRTADPPSTVGELHQVLIDYDAARPRSQQVRLGPSELGTPCQAQIARKLAGAPRRPVDSPAWAPIQGTAVHAEMEQVVAFWNGQLGRTRWLAEDDLAVDDEIRGHGDAYDTDHDMVVDWKHVGTTALTKLRAARRAGRPAAEQLSADYRIQAHLYGMGHERKGRPVKHVRLVLLARSWKFEDSDEWTEPYQPEVAIRALDRYYATKDLLTTFDVTNNPEMVTLVQAAPGDACRWCPFHRPGAPTNWAGCAGPPPSTSRQVAGLI